MVLSPAVQSFRISPTTQKGKFSIKDFFSKCDQIRNLVTFTEEILNGKVHFFVQCPKFISCTCNSNFFQNFYFECRVKYLRGKVIT